MNSKQKGGIGVATAVAHFAQGGDLVYVPVTETGCDLIIERNGVLLRVEVKSTWNAKGSASLMTNAGHYSYRGMKLGKFNGEVVDLLVVYNGNTGALKEFTAIDFHGRSAVTVR